MSGSKPKLDVVVSAIVEITDEIKRFEFQRTDGQDFPPFSGGAHIVIELDDDGTRRLNPYSLMSNPADTSTYAISVRRDDAGRGGSRYLHQKLQTGDRVTLSMPNNLFSLDRTASKHLMIAGGIGITPFLSQIKQLKAQKGLLGTAGKADFELHYFTRERAKAAYLGDLTDDPAVSLTTYFDNEDPDRDLTGVMGRQPLGTHLYVCGPKPMIDIVIEQARSIGWPDENIHYEEFVAPKPGEPFTVELAQSGLTVNVGGRQSLLEAIEEAGVDAPYMCRGGACGQCETKVIACEGTIEHRDHWLTDEQRDSNAAIMPCMSRFAGGKLVLER